MLFRFGILVEHRLLYSISRDHTSVLNVGCAYFASGERDTQEALL